VADPTRVVDVAHVAHLRSDLCARGRHETVEIVELERELRLRQPERFQDLSLERAGEAALRGLVDDPADEQVAGIRVRPARTWLEVEPPSEWPLQQLFVLPRLGGRVANGGGVFRQPTVVRDPARVVQQLPQGGAVTGRDVELEAEAQAEDAEKRLGDAVDEVAVRLGDGPSVCNDRVVKADEERVLERIREICLGLPETSERLSHGAPTFFVRDRRAFLMVLTNHHGDGRFAIWCAAADGTQGMLADSDPDRFFRPPYVGHRGWLGVRLDRGLDWDELAGIAEDAYAQVAPAKLVEDARATATGDVKEARLKETEHGLVPEGAGWYVLNTKDAVWGESAEFGRGTTWEGPGEARFQEVGMNITVLQPGQPVCMYHGEEAQEDFLVLAGEGVLIVEGEERPLKVWDFVHCPPWTKHVIVAGGSEPLVVIAVGGRAKTGLLYPVDETALKHGAGVSKETTDGDEAYAGASEVVRTRYVEGDLPL
jgi:uncharacterized cupin superfamily protein